MYFKIARTMGYRELLRTYNDKYFTLRYQDEEFQYMLDEDHLNDVAEDMIREGFNVLLGELEQFCYSVDMDWEPRETTAVFTVVGTKDLLGTLDHVRMNQSCVFNLEVTRVFSVYEEWDYNHEKNCMNDDIAFCIEVEIKLGNS
jgi:hypothetical protein